MQSGLAEEKVEVIETFFERSPKEIFAAFSCTTWRVSAICSHINDTCRICEHMRQLLLTDALPVTVTLGFVYSANCCNPCMTKLSTQKCYVLLRKYDCIKKTNASLREHNLKHVL
jgi:hypothetical protein